MKKARYKAPEPQEFEFIGSEVRLPTSKPMVVYYRQSTFAQLGNVSTAIQTIDMPEYAVRMGWSRELVQLIDMDAGVSGTKKIDERPGMKRLFELITDGQIGAVACQDEDRLFRDVTQIQVNIFIQACAENHVLVITPHMVYDFGHPYMGDFHARQFRFKCEVAADYIKTFVKGKLHRARQRMAMEGRWVGTALPPGFMIDTRRTLPDGSINEHWRRFAIFEPFAEAVARYFELFLETGGCINRTVRRIHKEGPYYPDPHTCPVPLGFRVPNREWTNWGIGYHPAGVGLEKILTCVAYIGHWAVEGVIVRYNNHPTIVDADTFMKAFNFLSPVTIEGAVNPHYKPFRQSARPTVESERPVDPPLCRGMIISFVEGEWRNVGTNWVSSKSHYIYKVHEISALRTYEWARVATQIDEAIVELLHQKLLVTFDSRSWDKTLASFGEVYDQERKRIGKQIVLLEKVMKNLIKSLQTLDEEDMIRAVQAQYREAKAEHIRLTSELERANDEKAKFQAVIDLRENIGPALQNWTNMTRDEKIHVLRAFIDHVEATPIDDNGLVLEIVWRDTSRDKTLVIRQTNGVDGWLKTEVDKLLQMVDAGASQIEIAASFPNRRWEYIRKRYEAERPGQNLYFDPQPIPYLESYEMYIERKNGEDKPKAAKSGDRWSNHDERILLELLDSGATQVQLAHAFPTRRWWRIRHHITLLRGKGVVIPEVGNIQRNETFGDYLARIGMSEDEYTVTVTGSTSKSDCPAESHAPVR